MIIQLDRIDVAVADVAAAAADYAALFGFPAMETGPGHARFRLANVDVLLLPATGAAGLAGLAFGVASLERAARLLGNRDVAFTRVDGPDGPALRIGPEHGQGAPALLEEKPTRDTRREAAPALAGAAAVTGVDHVVFRSASLRRAMAFWGAQMGLDLRFSRHFERMGARVTLFRCGDMKIEIASREDPAKAEAPDEAWGVSWRAGDIAALNARLAQEGFDVSEVRRGLQPGTQVFTIRNRTHGVATIAIGAGEDAAG